MAVKTLVPTPLLPALTHADEVSAEIAGQHIVVVGNTGSGKTWTAKAFVELLLRQRRRVCIWDPTGVWWGLRYLINGSAGFDIALIGGQFGDVPLDPDSGELCGEIVGSNDRPVIIDLSETTMGERHQFATDFFLSLYRHNRRPLHLIVDEADEVAPQNPLPETRRMLGAFDRIIRRGRVRGFRSMMITQRPAVLHKNVLSQATTLIAMRLIGSQDREAVKLWIKGQADMEQGEAMLASLPGLQTGNGWIWAPSLKQPLQKIHFPHIQTMDSSRTPSDEEPALTPPAGVSMAHSVLEYAERFASIPLTGEVATEVKPSKSRKTRGAEIDQDIVKASTTLAHDNGVAEGRNRERVAQRAQFDKIKMMLRAALRECGIDPAYDTDEPAAILPIEPQDLRAVQRTHVKKAARARADQSLESNGAARALLGAFAQFTDEAISWEEAAIIARMVPGNGYFYGGKKYLTAEGLIIERDGGRAHITPSGLSGVGGRQPKPQRNALIASWAGRLRPPGGKMLEVLAKNPRAVITIENLARTLGTKPGNGYWYGGMKVLRRANLIHEASGGVRLSDFLCSLK